LNIYVGILSWRAQRRLCQNIGCIVTYLRISDCQNAFEKPLGRIDILEISLVIE